MTTDALTRLNAGQSLHIGLPVAAPGTWREPATHFLQAMQSPWYANLVALQDRFTSATMEFWSQLGVRYGHLPVTTSAVSSPMGLGSDSKPVAVDMFGVETYLADSMQFGLEYLCRLSGQGAYYLMPSFRGEDVDATHLAQFMHSEAEIPGVLGDVLDVVERYLRHVTAAIQASCGDLICEPGQCLPHTNIRSYEYVNAKAVGIEHEGFAAQGTWYTETMYRTSAKLVRHLAFSLGIPLDRQHIIGHDNVPGITPPRVGAMHWDPGPYWNWSHYMDLLRAPLRGTGTHRTGLVTINPDFATNKPAFTNCPPLSNPGGPALPGPCSVRGSSSVILRQAPSMDAPLINDLGLRPDGTPNTMRVSDHGARASAGQKFAIAEVQGDWTAIWYLGRKAWFHNPPSARNALWSVGFVATPKAGKATIPVYGRAYPEEAAYPAGVPYQTIVPLQYTFAAGQRYTVGTLMKGEYYRATTFAHTAPGDGTVIRGDTVYVQVQFGHRIMYVNLADVDLLPSFL